ncbi:MAG: bifunctional demethylmenaquinone methyltransferase/2-methoxy-6-polyprenyl-1,4-benzoquinol methylase UbiE [Candidatus Marinimicrobia bacterium]|nr:bifunctional demethylmenaquinone methyltransferase/2-methoxy-6-polyprenyl-1,4-benzoquinol methylase UbiE [Candidatus Neomarinimicrobiota bacterium]MCF7839325.1 bifunctional demethylmenaquinone methyltransferase/2-methoxy-6-polyprenyl-1,4-benzoquinol methylase UbiE [Candidatus Neomarinimicrobiota bacterium]MCF7902179.1 bifunctional demethylmenaquinone methyltransferase/2-methoxy-6-polyprenyl-1,4-benzoquinol methylase UbiE [Candidatus Neomarinimicrobiota bacterium]
MTDQQFIHSGAEKKPRVQAMFNRIAGRYDFLNHALSLGIDILWRKKTLKSLRLKDGDRLLDVATGTADMGLLALDIAKVDVLGLDFAYEMLVYGSKKLVKKSATDRIHLVQGDAERIPLQSETMDAITIAYGMRNVGDIDQTLSEFYRTLRPGGRVAVLEFSLPSGRIFGPLFNFYFRKILPFFGGLFSNKTDYTYLPESVRHFPSRGDFMDLMRAEGFIGVECYDLTLGISSIFIATK